MKQRVGVARAFANDPEILLMDEPFASLDEQNKTLLQDELLRIWEETKKTVIRFGRPRRMMELRKEAAYGELVYWVWQLLYEEVMNSKA